MASFIPSAMVLSIQNQPIAEAEMQGFPIFPHVWAHMNPDSGLYTYLHMVFPYPVSVYSNFADDFTDLIGFEEIAFSEDLVGREPTITDEFANRVFRDADNMGELFRGNEDAR
jgi:hypothetical protein